MKLTHSQRQLFRMLANARRPSGRQGVAGPLLLGNEDRELAFRLAEVGENEVELHRWPAKEPRNLTAQECLAGLWLLESKAVGRWLKGWSYGDPAGRARIEALIEALIESLEGGEQI
jgi:hypothetical protein